MLRNPDLQEDLLVAGEPEFFDCCRTLGRDRGFHFHDKDLEAALQGAPLTVAVVPEGWTPVRFSLRNGNPAIEWVHAGNCALTEPFFRDSIGNALRLPFARMFRIEAPWRDVQPDARGFIFHVTRCGSTLVTRMLAAAGLRTISEAHMIDQILQADASEARRIEWLRAGVAALGNGPVFLKLDALHNRNHRLIRAASPQTPRIFLYRDPVEVLISQLANPGVCT